MKLEIKILILNSFSDVNIRHINNKHVVLNLNYLTCQMYMLL